MAYRFIQVGTGGHGHGWCETFLPPNIADGLVKPVAAVDINPEALTYAREKLALASSKCYTDIEKAFAETPADFCTIVVPPAHHEMVADLAVRHGLHILSEKPIADTMAGACRIAKKVTAAGLKMGVTMSHRFRNDITSLRKMVWSGQYGELDYLICRFTCDARSKGSWGRFRYEMPDVLMVEGSVHHLDLLADIASDGSGARCRTIYAHTWRPDWADFAGDCQGLVIMEMENGKRVVYEGAEANAVTLNGWGAEYIRAECQAATLIMNHRTIERLPHGRGGGQRGDGEPVPLLERNKWDNTWLIEKFVHWLDGGAPMETNVTDNLQSVALIFAAIESSRTGQPVDVQAFLEKANECVAMPR